MDTINPLLSFSVDEISEMGHEVDDICAESGSSSSSSNEEPVPSPREKIIRRKHSRHSLFNPQDSPLISEMKGGRRPSESSGESSGLRLLHIGITVRDFST
jgi:hypothetical protein